MRYIINVFVITILTILSFTSCQKEEMSTIDIAEQAYIANESTHSNQNKEMNMHLSKANIATNGIPSDKELFTTQIATPKDLTKKANSRSAFTHNRIVLCGDSLVATNYNQNNDFTGAVYQNQGCLSMNYGNTGADISYLLWVENAGNYDIRLNQLGKDMDIFLFSLDANGELDKCLGYSTAGGVANEFISAGLDLGTFALIVDAYHPGEISSFKLDISCAFVSNLPYCEDFDSWKTGAITPMTYDWVKFNSYSGDAFVSNAKANNGNQSLYCDEDSDVVYLLGKEYNSGVHHLSWSTFIPSGKSAALSFEKYNQPGKEHSIRVFMQKNNTISIVAKGQTFVSSYTYTQNQWIDFDVTYSLNSGQCALWIDNKHVANFCASLQYHTNYASVKRLAGINFWGIDADASFYIDDLCRTHYNPFSEASSTTPQTLNIHPDF